VKIIFLRWNIKFGVVRNFWGAWRCDEEFSKNFIWLKNVLNFLFGYKRNYGWKFEDILNYFKVSLNILRLYWIIWGYVEFFLRLCLIIWGYVDYFEVILDNFEVMLNNLRLSWLFWGYVEYFEVMLDNLRLWFIFWAFVDYFEVMLIIL